MRLKNLSVSKKVVAAFAAVLLASLGLGLFSILRLANLNADTVDITDEWMPSIGFLADMRYNATLFRLNQSAYVLVNTDRDRDQVMAILNDRRAAFEQAETKLDSVATGSDERALSDAIKVKWNAYRPTLDKLIEIDKRDGQAAAATYYMGPMKSAFDELNDAVLADMAFNRRGGVAASTKSATTFESARLLIFVALGLCILLCVAAGNVLVRGVSKPLVTMAGALGELAAGKFDAHVPHADQKDEIGQLATAMTAFKNQLASAERSKAEQVKIIVESIGAGLTQLAKGNLTHRIAADLTGPFAQLKEDFNAALERLQETLQSVLTSTHLIATGAGEISNAADDLSRRTEQQASSLEETAAALEEITSTVKKTSANTREATSSVATARTVAEEGGRVVETAIRAMDCIAQSSGQITDIIGVIDEIAFQTNLLALNAGVEAARAGDAGRGFAVVASEVRALAQRSSEAAKQIKTLINASGGHVGEGVKYVGESGKSLKHIVEQVAQIDALINEMAQAAEQQATGIEQVNSAIAQMDQVTQQNAAMVEQSTAASRNLADETQMLTTQVGFFNVGSEGAAVQRDAPRPPGSGAAARPQSPRTPSRSAPRRNNSPARLATAVAQKVEASADEWTEF